MRPHTFLISALMVVFLSVTAFADDLEGTLTVNEKPVAVRHVYALLHDNAEGILSSPRQLRLLLTDVEVPVDVLYGLRFVHAGEWQGKVNGLLLRFDPANSAEVDITMLLPKGIQTVSKNIRVSDLKMDQEYVSAAVQYIDPNPSGPTSSDIFPVIKFSFRFKTRLNHPPAVTADLKGRAALGSPQVKTLRTIANTIAAGNFKALEKLSSESAVRRNRTEIERRGKSAKKIYMKMGAEVRKLIPGVKRVVVRGDHAVIILPKDGSYDMVLEDGVWKGN